MVVTVKSIDEAVSYSYSKLNKKIVIVSITCLNDSLPNFNLENENILGILELHFNDIERQYKDYQIPKKEDFKELKKFIDNYKNTVDEIVVHCHAGISRSSATASAICRYLNIDDSFIWDSYMYHPNRLVFKLALEQLGISLNDYEIEKLYKRNEEAQENCPYLEKLEEMFIYDNSGKVVSINLKELF